jgi:hypothetical protein
MLALAAVIVGVCAGGVSARAKLPPPTVKECTDLVVKSPPFRGSRLASTVSCLRPTSIRTSATMAWTTCPTTPKGESCAEGAVGVSFRSTGAGFGGKDADSWGGENFPGGGIFALPGTGTFTCRATYVGAQGDKYAPYSTNVKLRDQAAGFAVVGSSIKVATSIHPGHRGALGLNASVKLGQPNTCQVPGLPVAMDAVRQLWPGALVSATALAGTKTTVTSSGKKTLSYPVSSSEGLEPGVKIQVTLRWTNAVAVIPALTRR